MLKRNVYITYPAGYMGTYINWMLSVSEKNKKISTVLQPLTNSNNAHNHLKIPTHLSWNKLLTWIAYNRPTDKKIYALNCRKSKDWWLAAEYAIQNIMQIDPDPVIINCHDSGNMDQMKFGSLNMFTKWPTFIRGHLVWEKNKYDPCFDEDPIRARNWFLDNWSELNPGNQPINSDIVMYNLKRNREWLEIRKQTASLEMTPEQYLIPSEMSGSLLDVSLLDIVSPDFPSLIQKWVEDIDLGEWDFDHANKYHSTYVASQDNLKWFKYITTFRENRIVDPWLLSNTMLQAFLLLEFPRDQVEPLLKNTTEFILEKLL